MIRSSICSSQGTGFCGRKPCGGDRNPQGPRPWPVTAPCPSLGGKRVKGHGIFPLDPGFPNAAVPLVCLNFCFKSRVFFFFFSASTNDTLQKHGYRSGPAVAEEVGARDPERPALTLLPRPHGFCAGPTSCLYPQLPDAGPLLLRGQWSGRQAKGCKARPCPRPPVPRLWPWHPGWSAHLHEEQTGSPNIIPAKASSR